MVIRRFKRLMQTNKQCRTIDTAYCFIITK